MTTAKVKMANDFWFDYDNRFRYEPAQDILNAYGVVGLDRPIDLFRKTRGNGTYPGRFISGLRAYKKPIEFLTQQQEIVLDAHFAGSTANRDMTSAFVQFGQGLLTDSRRDLPKYQYNVIHSMDGSAKKPPIGYHRWHGFIRAFTLLNGIDDGQWLQVDRNMALAWDIQSRLKPVGITDAGSNPNTKKIDPAVLRKLKSNYLKMSFEELDEAFDHAPYPTSR